MAFVAIAAGGVERLLRWTLTCGQHRDDQQKTHVASMQRPPPGRYGLVGFVGLVGLVGWVGCVGCVEGVRVGDPGKVPK